MASRVQVVPELVAGAADWLQPKRALGLTASQHTPWADVFEGAAGAGRPGSGARSVVAPGVLPSAAEVVHAISTPLEEPLLVLHAYGGGLFATPRSNWDSETRRDIPFEWHKARARQAE